MKLKFLLLIKLKLYYVGESFVYSADYCRGGHIVEESFEFIPREEEEKNIVGHFEYRKMRRQRGKTDKIVNALITTVASPGFGKSTLLVHLPLSKSYRNYINNTSPIVSTLSFNSGMGFETPDVFSLRILYGASQAMGLFENNQQTWFSFQKKWNYIDLTTIDAINILEKLFGFQRPIIILVDELSKAKNDKLIMPQLGSILDAKENCDLVVSSLSPQYIDELLTGSQRRINYVPLKLLLNENLGKQECLNWANTLITFAGGENIVFDSIKKNALKNSYLLLSVHPRSLQYMVELFKSQ